MKPQLFDFPTPKPQFWHRKGYVPSLDAPHHLDDLVFRRQQSPSMAAREWEREPQWASWLAGLFAAIFIGACIFFL